MPSLILLKSPGGAAMGQNYPLTPGMTQVIGRDADQCQIVIPNSSVSRKHAVIHSRDGKYVVEDLGSRNGTLINQNRITNPTALKHDDRVKICDFLFRYHDETAPVPVPETPEEENDASDADEGGMTTVRQTFHIGSAKQYLETQTSEKMRALLEISTGLSRTLELEPLLPQVADSLFSVFLQADRCFIILLDEQGRMIPKVEKSRRARPGDVGTRFSKTIVRKCLDSQQAYLSEDAANDESMGAAQSIAEFRIRSVMCVPLFTAEGKALGALQLDAQDISKKFKEDDLKMLTIVANLASVAIEKAQVHAVVLSQEKARKEIEIARKVQVGFLPSRFPDVPGYEFFAFYSPAQSVGGDFYDIIALPGGRVAVCLGDVAGKGVAAALLMAKLSAEVRFCFLTEADPALAVGMLNNLLIHGGIGDRFVTFAVLLIDPIAHQMTVVNAGHINPMKIKIGQPGPMVDIIDDSESGLPLGLVEDNTYTSKVIPLDTWDTFLVFTDGVIDAEAPNDDRFNHDGIHAVTSSMAGTPGELRPQHVGDRVVKSVIRHMNGRAQFDDIAVVCFGRVDSNNTTGSVLVPRLMEPISGRYPKE
ncbi:MAG: SpoIIE family protein phosphatase [Fimbriiglobus sp.]